MVYDNHCATATYYVRGTYAAMHYCMHIVR
jgi:hypothetical protein